MKEGWEIKKLGEVCDILDSQRRPVTKKDRREGIYPYYGASGIQDYVDSYIFDGRYLLVGEDGAKWGANDKSAFIIEGKTWVNNHAHILKINDEIIDSYVERYLVFKDLSEYITGAVVPKLTQQALRNIPIPVPPLSPRKSELFPNWIASIVLLRRSGSNLRNWMHSHNPYSIICLETLFKMKRGGKCVRL